MKNAMQGLFTVNLRAKPSETVLVLADERSGAVRPITSLAARIAGAGRGLARVRFSIYPETGRHGIEPPECAWRVAFGDAAIGEMQACGILAPLLAKRATPGQMKLAGRIVRRHRRDAPDAAMIVTEFSATHTVFRSLLNRAAGCRVASMPSFRESMLRTAVCVDHARMAVHTRRVAALLTRAGSVRVRNADGTDLAFSLQGRRAFAETGLLGPGRFCNLPAGEAYIAPVEGTAEGVLATRRVPQGGRPVVFEFRIRGGRVRRVEGGGAYAGRFERLFAANPGFAVLAELGVGTNDRAVESASMLEAEKILGTVHIAFGDNSTFGGRNRAAFHQDFLVRAPVVTLAGLRGRTVTLLPRR